MSNRDSLRRESSSLSSTFLWIGLPLSVLVGLVLGWQYYLSPSLALGPIPTPTPGEIPTRPTPEVTIPVPSIGSTSVQMGQAVQVGLPAPNFTLPDLNGDLLSLNMFRDSVVLINFWTTWCPPCKEEMPALQEAYENFKDEGFVVLGINWTQVDDPEQVEPFILELGLTFPILLDALGEVSEDLYNILGLPTSVFVDRDGNVREIYIGPLQLDSLESKIQTLIGASL